LVVNGNHDYYGNASAQVAYQDPTKRWTFPAPYHARRFEQNGVKVMFVMLDTWKLNGGDALVG
jgi:tartrate-resistant acid phosphatase type 5